MWQLQVRIEKTLEKLKKNFENFFRGTGMKAGVAHPAIYTHPMIGTFPHVRIEEIIQFCIKSFLKIGAIVV
jgi:hypothetical protein